MLFSLEKNFIKEQDQLINSLQDEVMAKNDEIDGLRNEIEELKKEKVKEKERMERRMEERMERRMREIFEEQAERMKGLTVKIRKQEMELSLQSRAHKSFGEKNLGEEKGKDLDKKGLEDKRVIHDYGKLFLIEL